MPTNRVSENRIIVNKTVISAAVARWLREKPPVDNMGVRDTLGANLGTQTTFTLDTWRASILLGAKFGDHKARAQEIDRLMTSLSVVGMQDWMPRGYGLHRYHQVLDCPLGAQLWIEPVTPSKDGSEHVTLSLQGQAMGRLGWNGIKLLALELETAGWQYQITRLDPAFDTSLFSMDDVWEAEAARAYTGQFRAEPELHRNSDGKTIYWGSRQSEAMLRTYHKVVENHPVFGNEAFTRCEMEYKGLRAGELWVQWLILDFDPERCRDLALSYMKGFIQIDRDWWRVMVNGVDRIWVQVRAKVDQTIERTERFLRRQTAKAFARMMRALSSEQEQAKFLYNLLSIGEDKLTEFDLAQIEQARNSGQYQYFIPDRLFAF